MSAKSHYCEIRVGSETVMCGKYNGTCVRPRDHEGGCSNPAQPGDGVKQTEFFRGQGSSYRVAAERAIAHLVISGVGDNGQAATWENVTIRTGRVG